MPDTRHETTYTITVNELTLTTLDPKITGRQLRGLAGATPASAYVLILIAKNSTQSVGLERTINLSEMEGQAVFRLFKGDRTYSFTINERGFEWGDASISGDDIRAIAAIPDDHELIVDSDGDRVLEDDEDVRLKREGVERIFSRPGEARSVTIIVNTRPKLISSRWLTFIELIELAFETPPVGENVAFTVSYRKGPKRRPEGSLLEGGKIRIKEGMVFNVSATDKS